MNAPGDAGGERRARWLPLVAFMLGVSACVAATWPAAATWRTHALVPVGYADVQAGMWWPRQVGDALLQGKNPFYAESLFWPVGQDVTRLVWNVLAELVLFPLWQVATPLAALNLAAFVVAGFNAAACAWAVRRLGGGAFAALAAAVMAGASHFGFMEMVNGRIEQAFWAPVAIFLAELAAPNPRPVRAGVWLGLAAAVYWFYGYFLLLVVLAWLASQRTHAALITVTKLGAVSALTALPFLLPVVLNLSGRATANFGLDTLPAQAVASLPLPGGAWWPAGVEPAFAAMSAPLYVVPFALWGVLRGRGAVRTLATIALATTVLAMGPFLVARGGEPLGGGRWWLPHAALNVLPGMSRFWWCYRWLTLAIPASIIGLAWALRERRVLLALVALASLGETACLIRGGSPFPRLPRLGVRPPPALEFIAALPSEAPVLVLPRGGVNAIFIGWQAWFRQPVDIGLAQHIPGVTPAGISDVMGSSVLGKTINDPSLPVPVRWTPEETQGFAYVLLFFRDAAPGSRRHDAETSALDARLTAVLGAPFARNDIAAWWAIPGVSPR